MQVALLYEALQQQMGLLLNSLHHGIVVTDRDNEVMLINGAGETVLRLLGIDSIAGRILVAWETGTEQFTCGGRFRRSIATVTCLRAVSLFEDISERRWEEICGSSLRCAWVRRPILGDGVSPLAP